jgi:pimeloyl-ACP methyl ester carboxylesterase
MAQEESLAEMGFNSSCPFQDEHGDLLRSWPVVKCNGIDEVQAKSGIEEVLKRLDGNPDNNTWAMIQKIRSGPDSQTFGVPFFNETYVRWFYRVVALEHNICFHDQRYQMRSPVTNRSYNLLERMSTAELAYDIELVRGAIGAKKMSVYGVSYGTKVGSVYATIFPDKIHRLILDGDMGSDPDIESFAGWVGQSTEAVWTGLAASCDNSVMGGGPPETVCPAGPGVTRKLHKLFKNAITPKERSNAVSLFMSASQVIYSPGAPGAGCLMECMAKLYASGEPDNCTFLPQRDGTCQYYPDHPENYPGTRGGLDVIASVLGMDLAGRLTEESFIEWWRSEKDMRPLGLTRSLGTTVAVGTWPAVPRPDPPAGNSVVAPLVIGNLHDGQTPYKMAQRMIDAFPSGSLLTTQFYGYGLQGPQDVDEVVKRYEEEMRKGVPPTYDDEAAKFLCVKVALKYLKDGHLPRDHVCKAAGPVATGPGPVKVSRGSGAQVVIV